MPQTSLPAQEAVPPVTLRVPSLAELAGPPHVPSLPELPGPPRAPSQKAALEQLRQEHEPPYTEPIMTVKPPPAAKSAPMQFLQQPEACQSACACGSHTNRRAGAATCASRGCGQGNCPNAVPATASGLSFRKCLQFPSILAFRLWSLDLSLHLLHFRSNQASYCNRLQSFHMCLQFSEASRAVAATASSHLQFPSILSLRLCPLNLSLQLLHFRSQQMLQPPPIIPPVPAAFPAAGYLPGAAVVPKQIAPMQLLPQPAGPQLQAAAVPGEAAPTQLLQKTPSPAIAPVPPQAAPVTAAAAPHVQELALATAHHGPAAPAAAKPDEKVLVQQNMERNMEKLGWKVGTGALQLKFDRKGRVDWTESLFWDGPKDGYYFSTGEHGVGYYMDKAFVSSPTWQGKRAHKIFTTRDGQTGYYFDDHVEVDSSEFLAMQSLGWLKSPAPEKEEQSQPAAVNKGLQVGVAAAKKAQQFELPVAKPVTTPAVEYGHRACWGLVNRLRKNPTRLAKQSEELQQLIVISARNEADKKKLYGIIAGCNGVLKDINVKVKEPFETCDVENEKTETVPVTELELQAMYGEQTESVKRHKEAMGECKDDPNLPGAKIYLLAREKVEAGTETKRRCLVPSQLQFLICFPIKL